MKLLRRLAVLPIRFYQRFLSPLKPPTCRFEPSCSAYAHEAILRHGIVKGWLLAVWRLLRCQPFSEGGLDPVPPAGAWRSPRPSRIEPDTEPAAAPRSRDEKRG